MTAARLSEIREWLGVKVTLPKNANASVIGELLDALEAAQKRIAELEADCAVKGKALESAQMILPQSGDGVNYPSVLYMPTFDLVGKKIRTALQPGVGKALLDQHAAEIAELKREIEAERLANRGFCQWNQELKASVAERDATIVKLREELRALHQERKGEVWFWQGDAEDHVESLTCPVLIAAEALRKLLADHAEPKS